MTDQAAREGVRRHIEESRSRLMDFARRNNRGGCKILSEGGCCTCLLCDITTLYANAIAQLYANAIAQHELSELATLRAENERLRSRLAAAERLLHQPSYEVSYLAGSKYERVLIQCMHSRPGWNVIRDTGNGPEFMHVKSGSPIDAYLAAVAAGWLPAATETPQLKQGET